MAKNTVLYRKYRPNSFSDLKGQVVIKDILTESIKSKTFGHAYLFTGPRGTGKTTTARLTAKALSCLNFSDNMDVCNHCANCTLINNQAAQDIIEMDAASNRGIEEIRELKENVNFLPSALKHKVYIIDEAHMLTREAFNALLKTLEDTPEHVVFILATTEPHKVPITVRSRLLRFDFQLADESILVNKLKEIAKSEDINITDGALNKLYKVSGGSFRDAESLLAKVTNHNSSVDESNINDLLGIADDELIKNFINSLETKNMEVSKEILNGIFVKGIDIEHFLEQTIEFSFENSVNPNIVELFFDLKEKIGNFNNKKTYLLAKLYTFLNVSFEVKSKSIIPAQEESKPNQNRENLTQGEVKSKEIEPQKVDEELADQKTKSEEIETQISSNAENIFAGIKNKRIEAILSVSQVIQSDKKIEIINEFQFNVNFLKKTDSLAELKSSISATLGEEVEIEVRKGEKKTESRLENTKFIEPTVPKKKLKNYSPKETAIEEKTKTSDTVADDNTELVEKIFM